MENCRFIEKINDFIEDYSTINTSGKIIFIIFMKLQKFLKNIQILKNIQT